MGGKAYVEEVKLIGGGANRVGKEEGIALGPADLLGGILETNTGARHGESGGWNVLFGEVKGHE